jgi:hypothetical protein
MLEVEVERGDDYISQCIKELNKSSNKLDWHNYVPVFEKVAEFLANGCLPDYTELSTGNGCSLFFIVWCVVVV